MFLTAFIATLGVLTALGLTLVLIACLFALTDYEPIEIENSRYLKRMARSLERIANRIER